MVTSPIATRAQRTLPEFAGAPRESEGAGSVENHPLTRRLPSSAGQRRRPPPRHSSKLVSSSYLRRALRGLTGANGVNPQAVAFVADQLEARFRDLVAGAREEFERETRARAIHRQYEQGILGVQHFARRDVGRTSMPSGGLGSSASSHGTQAVKHGEDAPEAA
jgi:hypothetical protein